MKKLIIIPAYNESGSIQSVVDNVKQHAPEWDFVIVNDCSTDDTADICSRGGWTMLELPLNLGIGGAMQTGYKYAKEEDYELAVQIDGDGQHDAAYIMALEKKLLDTGADMVIGSRFLEREGFLSSRARRIGIRYLSWLIRLLAGKRITDPTSGMRLSNRKVIEMFAESYPADYPEPESSARVLKTGLQIVEVPVRMKERSAGRSSIHGFKSVYYMVKVTIAILLAGK